MKSQYGLFLMAITIISIVSCTPNATPQIIASPTSTLTLTPTITSTPQPTLSPTPEPTATSAYYASLSADQQILYNSVPNMDDKGWDKKFLPKPFENYVGFYNSNDVVAIYDPKSEKVFNVLLVGNNIFVNESKSAISYNPKFSEDEARSIVDNVMQWYRIRLCTSQKGVVLPNKLEDVLASPIFQDYLDDCTITLRSWTYQKFTKERDEGCAPYYYSVPEQKLTVSKDTGIILWLNSKRIENTVNVCLAEFDGETRGLIVGYYLGTAVGVEQVSGGPIEIAVYRPYEYYWDNYAKYKLADALQGALRHTSMRVYRKHMSDDMWSRRLDENFYKIMERWIINYSGFGTEPPLIYETK